MYKYVEMDPPLAEAPEALAGAAPPPMSQHGLSTDRPAHSLEMKPEIDEVVAANLGTAGGNKKAAGCNNIR